MIIGILKGSLVTNLILKPYLQQAAILQLGCLVLLLMVIGNGGLLNLWIKVFYSQNVGSYSWRRHFSMDSN